jgi:hypothetical protein
VLDGIDLPADMDRERHLPVNAAPGHKDEHCDAYIRQDIESHGHFPNSRFPVAPKPILPWPWSLS